MPNSGLVRLGVTRAVGSALFDYAENLGITAMMWSWPDVLGPLVYAASFATIAKSVITNLAVMPVFATAFVWTRLPKASLRIYVRNDRSLLLRELDRPKQDGHRITAR
ncbi:hypothetical protein [Ruegeria sp. Alg231-54]|uniref:hypothetical protein n=1 Tax=Ruegeria sp. Alg231-54 TaxID=1922221 RepID=UPI000D557297|nr:hypothetical protein [Ruegeria sp. Alg231-54]